MISLQAEDQGTTAPVHGAAVNSFFIIFVHHQDAPGPTAYRGDDGDVVVYDSCPAADAVVAQLLATNKTPNISFTVTEFQPCH